MGNTVSAAEITAAQIVGSTEVEADFTPISRRLHGSPPLECPIHRKEAGVIIISYFYLG
jgi:hypothetical protein